MKLFEKTPKVKEEPVVEEPIPQKIPDFLTPEEKIIREFSAPEVSLPEAAPIPQKQKKPLRPEAVMGIIALLSAVLLAVTVLFCLPYMLQPEEDPEALLREQHAHQSTEPPTEAEGEEEIPLEEPTEPTVHPEANPYDRLDFQYGRNNYMYCLRQTSYIGVDVSAFQGNIDWKQVRQSGIQFAMLRLGYRGYESGRLVKDEYIDRNLAETAKVGMPIGVYFFSQALTIKEVDEEIEFMLDILGDYELRMPIVLDWEIPTNTARTAEMDRRTLTELQRYFCQTMTEKGFTPMIYFNWYQSTHLLHLDELEDYPFWLALYQDRMTYPYRVEMWQYTDHGRVPGIQGGVDLNIYLPEE